MSQPTCRGLRRAYRSGTPPKENRAWPTSYPTSIQGCRTLRAVTARGQAHGSSGWSRSRSTQTLSTAAGHADAASLRHAQRHRRTPPARPQARGAGRPRPGAAVSAYARRSIRTSGTCATPPTRPPTSRCATVSRSSTSIRLRATARCACHDDRPASCLRTLVRGRPAVIKPGEEVAEIRVEQSR
jgi:hypothetical protein